MSEDGSIGSSLDEPASPVRAVLNFLMFLRSLQRVAECSPDSPLIRIGFAYAAVVRV